MKNLVIAIVCFIIAVFCVVGMSWGDERKDDDPVHNIVVSTSYIGPPAGFVGGSTPPTATGCTLSGASMQ